jgi:hypothetical protein
MEVSWSIASEQSRHRALRFGRLQARGCPTADRLDIQQMEQEPPGKWSMLKVETLGARVAILTARIRRTILLT